jgi:hypothetical protein
MAAANRDIDFLGKAIIVRSTDPNDPNIVAATVMKEEYTLAHTPAPRAISSTLSGRCAPASTHDF